MHKKKKEHRPHRAGRLLAKRLIETSELFYLKNNKQLFLTAVVNEIKKYLDTSFKQEDKM